MRFFVLPVGLEPRRFAVPEKLFALRLSFSTVAQLCAFASSATGSAQARFPLVNAAYVAARTSNAVSGFDAP